MAVLAPLARATAMSAHSYRPYAPPFLALAFLAFIVAGMGNA
jgi:hypothetical protein